MRLFDHLIKGCPTSEWLRLHLPLYRLHPAIAWALPATLPRQCETPRCGIKAPWGPAGLTAPPLEMRQEVEGGGGRGSLETVAAAESVGRVAARREPMGQVLTPHGLHVAYRSPAGQF